MKVIGIAGLPGSGKSRLMDELQAKGYAAIMTSTEIGVETCRGRKLMPKRESLWPSVTSCSVMHLGDYASNVKWVWPFSGFFSKTTHGNALRIVYSALFTRNPTDLSKEK